MIKCQLCGETDDNDLSGFSVDESKTVQSMSYDFVSVTKLVLCGSCLNGLSIYSDEYKKVYDLVNNLHNSISDILNITL